MTSIDTDWGNIFDSIPDFFSVHNLDQKILLVNKSLADFLGVSKEELQGRYCYEVFHGTANAWKGCAQLRCMDSGKTVTEIIDDPNIGFPLMISCSPYYDRQGKLAGTLHIAKNMTEQHLAAEENENLISELVKSLTSRQRLGGFLPICASCKKIRDDNDDWNDIESYLKKCSAIQFSHSICPECSEKLYPEFQNR